MLHVPSQKAMAHAVEPTSRALITIGFRGAVLVAAAGRRRRRA